MLRIVGLRPPILSNHHFQVLFKFYLLNSNGSGGLPCMGSPTLLQTILMALFLFIVSIAFFMPLNCNK